MNKFIQDCFDGIKTAVTEKERESKYNIGYQYIMDIIEEKFWKGVGPKLDRMKLKQLRRRNLTRSEILEIKKRLKNGEKQRSIYEDLRVSKYLVSKINTGALHKDIN